MIGPRGCERSRNIFIAECLELVPVPARRFCPIPFPTGELLSHVLDHLAFPDWINASPHSHRLGVPSNQSVSVDQNITSTFGQDPENLSFSTVASILRCLPCRILAMAHDGVNEDSH